MHDIVANDDLYELQVKYPESIYSHETAVMLHWLGAGYHSKYHLSVRRNYCIDNAEEQLIKLHYVSEDELSDEYVTIIDSWESNPIRVTNMEKTIVDMFRKDQIMTEVIKEMVNDYIRHRSDKNLLRLKRYAKDFDVLYFVEEEILQHLL